jgi:predicted Zn-dependent protease
LKRCLTFAAAVLLAAAQVEASLAENLPATPIPGYRPAAASDEGGLWMLTEKQEHAIAVSPSRITDPQLNAYVKGVICKLSREQCQTLRLYIVDTPQFNAFAMPNGAIVVYSGLLLRLDNEAELAFVLGHEITHYTHKHTLARFERATRMSNVLAFFALVTMGLGVGGLAGVTGNALAANLLAYSRDQEREADATGFDLAVAAGYDPQQAGRTWRFVSDEHKANPRRIDIAAFLSTHPQDTERMASLDARAAQVAPSRTTWFANDADYRDAMHPFLARWLEGEINRGEPEESVVLLSRLVANQPASGVLRYYLGVAYRKRGGAGDLDAARTAYGQAIACADAPSAAWRDQGLLAMRSGDKSEARVDFEKYLSAAPAADDKAMIQYYLAQLSGN